MSNLPSVGRFLRLGKRRDEIFCCTKGCVQDLRLGSWCSAQVPPCWCLLPAAWSRNSQCEGSVKLMQSLEGKASVTSAGTSEEEQ